MDKMESSAQPPVSRFAGLSLACRRSERLVFAGLDFAVESGGALLLTGPNGSGKSSLLRLMAGLIRPYAGRLEWNGVKLSGDPARHREVVTYLGHQDAVKPVLTVAESVRLWGGHKDGRVEAALAAMGLGDLANLPGRFLSSGQRRRTALARVIAAGTPLWLLDEPTVGLDTKAITALESALAAHRGAGGIVVAATHVEIDLPGAQSLDLSAFEPQNFYDEAVPA
jgi:heme exporter protein A